MQASNRVVMNTTILYIRMLITMVITFWSTRFILAGLGISDYGVYNIVAGVVGMLSFLNSAMSTSTQRYLSFYQGKQDQDMQRKVFGTSLLLHIAIGLAVVLILEFLGYFLFGGFLNIAQDRVAAAKVVYHFISATVFFTIISVPFTASITAHENIYYSAFVNVIEAVLKFLIALSLLYFNGDKLIFYGLLVACISIITFILYAIFCIKKYNECSIRGLRLTDMSLAKELSSFAGWNLFGSLCAVGRSQGTNILFNLFYGTVMNAAYGIAGQVAGQLNFLSATMLRAINPQIMKSEGANDRARMLRLAMIASKFGFFLLAIVAIPVIFEMKSLLGIWLESVPEHSVIFCQLILTSFLIMQLTVGLQSAAQATGKIKTYQMIIGLLLLCNLPIAYILLSLNFPPYAVLIGTVCLDMVACCFRLGFLRVLAGLSIPDYINRVFAKVIIPVTVSSLASFLVVSFIEAKFRFILTGTLSSIFFIVGVYFTGLSNDERKIIGKVSKKISKKLNRNDEVVL